MSSAPDEYLFAGRDAVLTRQLFTQAKALTFVFPLVSSIVACYLIFLASAPATWVLIWLTVTCLLSLVRWRVLADFAVADRRGQTDYARWLQRYTLLEVCCGISAGMLGGFVTLVDSSYVLILTIITVGQSTTSIMALIAHRPAFIGFVSTNLGTYALWLLISGNPKYQLSTLLIVLVLPLLLHSYRVLHLATLKSAKLTHDNQQLASDLKQANRDLHAEQARAERALLVKKQFLSHMSQELRTPMNGVLGALSVLNRRPQGREESMLSDIAYRTSRSMMTLLSEILDLSQEDPVEGKSHAVAFDARMLLEEVIELLSCSAQVKDLRLLTLLPASFPARLKGEPHRIRQILLNLVGNAIKFTPSGSVTLKADVIDNALRVEVVDTGPGISQTQIATLMADDQMDELGSVRSTGKGLLLCRELCSMLGGEMGIASDLGRGSRFWISLPTEVLERAAPVTESGRTVILVSDHPGVREMLASQLARLGHGVSMLDSAEPLQTLLEQSRETSLVMLDMDLKRKISIQQYLKLQRVAAARGHHLVAMSAAGAHRLADSVHNLMLPCRLKVLQRVLAEHHGVDQAVSKQPPAPVPEPKPAGAGRRVLVIDDSDINRLLLKRMLQELGWRVDLAESLDQAGHFIGQQNYQLIILDAGAAGGDAAIDHLRNSNQATRLLVVADPTDARRASQYRKQGADGLLSRPITLENLEDTLTGVTVGVVG